MKKKNFSCRDCVYLQKRNNKFFCVRWSCYTTLKSIKFKEDADLNRLCIPHSRLLENEINLLKIIYGKPLSGVQTDDEKKIENITLKIWESKLNSLPLDEIDNLINSIKNGRIQTYNDRRIREIAENLPENADGGRLLRCYNKSRSKSNALIAAAICGGSSGGVDSRTFFYKKELILEQWAKHSHCWYDDIEKYAQHNGWKRATDLDGKESLIYTTPFNMIAKIWSMTNYNENLRLAVEKIILNNFFFGDETFLNVIGFTKVNHRLHFVLLQPKITHIEENNKNYNGIAIKKYLESKFPKQDIDKYKDTYIVHLPGCAISDLHGNNVVKSKKGNFYVIDCNIRYVEMPKCPWYRREIPKLGDLPFFNIVETDFEDIYAVTNDFYGKIYSNNRVSSRYVCYIDGKSIWRRFFKLRKTTRSYYILSPIERIGGDFYYNDKIEFAVDSATWENCFKHITAYPSPLFDNEIKLLKLIYN
ncbi:MAG: hypothetical protein K5685_08945 [Bacteroidales bacterium]|nr:hypothetical protein [Bacteroidales bacterium]